jgi:hypothetical protein
MLVWEYLNTIRQVQLCKTAHNGNVDNFVDNFKLRRALWWTAPEAQLPSNPASPVLAIVLGNPAFVAGPPRSVMKTWK